MEFGIGQHIVFITGVNIKQAGSLFVSIRGELIANIVISGMAVAGALYLIRSYLSIWKILIGGILLLITQYLVTMYIFN